MRENSAEVPARLQSAFSATTKKSGPFWFQHFISNSVGQFSKADQVPNFQGFLHKNSDDFMRSVHDFMIKYRL